MKILFALIVLFSATEGIFSQSGCASDSLYMALDFWIGEWEVYNEKQQKVGTNKIEKIVGGCAVMEHWVNSAGQEGKSLFYVDNNSRSMKQVWVTGAATKPWGQKEKTLLHAHLGRTALFQGWYTVNGIRILDRTLLEKVDPTTVSQTIETSSDGGRTWQISFVGIYRRR